jgi:C-terminal processing protease CtpA/Prc
VDHGLTLELGVYVTKILPGSVAAKEGVIAVGDRIVNVSDASAKKNDS